MSEFTQFRRKQIAELRPYQEGEILSERVSISAADLEAGSPKVGDMIARNPKNHDDQWLVAKQYFEDNFEGVTTVEFENGSLTFGQAIEAAKNGKRVARKGWNGANMFAYIVPAASYPAQRGSATDYWGVDTMVPYRAYWALKTAQEDVATWSPSGSDSLAEDWIILD